MVVRWHCGAWVQLIGSGMDGAPAHILQVHLAYLLSSCVVYFPES